MYRANIPIEGCDGCKSTDVVNQIRALMPDEEGVIDTPELRDRIIHLLEYKDAHFTANWIIASEVMHLFIAKMKEIRKDERKAIQDFYQTKDGDIVIPKAAWQALKEKKK